MDAPAAKVAVAAAADPIEWRDPGWFNALALLVWLAAGTVAFLPFAFDTSPFDAVMLDVPGSQGNWWHALAGAPFFLAFPVIWLRLRALFSAQPVTLIERRILAALAALSVAGTLSVETPFLFHLAGTSELQRLIVLGLGFGIVIASIAILLLRRRRFTPAKAVLVGLNTAWLANASLTLVVYADAAGSMWSKSGWMVTAVVVWPILVELVWLLAGAFQTEPSQISAAAA